MERYLFLLITMVMSLGCTHAQLRRNSVGQAQSVMEIHQQQVLNNLAMFAYEPNSFPSFALPQSGTNQLQDTHGLQLPTAWGRFVGIRAGLFGITQTNFNPNLQRVAQQSWSLNPINDPRKLDLMRCAYQAAVRNCGVVRPSTNCIDCQKRFNAFYTGDPKKDVSEGGFTSVTSECLTGECWFGVGCKKCIPKDCGTYVGEYCGLYVWIPPEGRDQFAQLTLAILDFAVTEPKKLATPAKEVVYYFDSEGRPTFRPFAVGEVRAKISASDKNETLLTNPYVLELREILRDNDVTLRNTTPPLANMDESSTSRAWYLLKEVQAGNDPDGLKGEMLDRILKRNGITRKQFAHAPVALLHDKPRAEFLLQKIEELSPSFRAQRDSVPGPLHLPEMTAARVFEQPESRPLDILQLQQQLNRVTFPQ